MAGNAMVIVLVLLSMLAATATASLQLSAQEWQLAQSSKRQHQIEKQADMALTRIESDLLLGRFTPPSPYTVENSASGVQLNVVPNWEYIGCTRLPGVAETACSRDARAGELAHVYRAVVQVNENGHYALTVASLLHSPFSAAGIELPTLNNSAPTNSITIEFGDTEQQTEGSGAANATPLFPEADTVFAATTITLHYGRVSWSQQGDN